jgi:hypothetical protein
VSSILHAETHREAKRLGAFSVLNKPFELDDFRTAVFYLVDPAQQKGGAQHQV